MCYISMIQFQMKLDEMHKKWTLVLVPRKLTGQMEQLLLYDQNLN